MTSQLQTIEPDRQRDPRARASQRPDAIGGPIAVDRLLFFSDAVFAISATLLALDLRLPPGLTSVGFQAALRDQLPAIAAYTLSFVLIGLLWLFHHRTFDFVARVDDTMLVGSLGLLCLVAFLPFPVRLLSEYHDEPAAVAIYMATFAAASATQRLLWVYATGHPRLLARPIDEQLRRRYNLMLATTPLGFDALVPIALLAPRTAVALWALLLPVRLVAPTLVRHIGRGRGRTADKAAADSASPHRGWWRRDRLGPRRRSGPNVSHPGSDRHPARPGDADPRLIREALLAREPLFHRRDLVSTRADFERETTPDFWEVGASGNCYSRETVWATLARRYAAERVDEAEVEGWQVSDARVRRTGSDTYLMTYLLSRPGARPTRRLTVWQGSVESGWKAAYHQGTVIARE